MQNDLQSLINENNKNKITIQELQDDINKYQNNIS